ncbi:MAG: magnesium and cobalt transport protein CorA [Bacteroidales bacterium]|nr:magnesium and cobalt transport protein CorA [Bacteroidales bacterium]
MVEIFYKSAGGILVSESEEILGQLTISDVLWVDLFSPTGEEKRAVEAFLGITLQTRAQAEEIESSSRFFEDDDAIFANSNFVIPGPEEYSMETVSFILSQGILTTIRECPLRSFSDLQRRIQAFPKNYIDGDVVFLNIVEQRVDLDADIIELLGKEVEKYSRKVNLGEDINEEFLLDINQMQENMMLVRENIVDKQRVISSILKSENYPSSLKEKLSILLKDISSLINHTNFSFERLEYLQNTVIGIINLDQNKIMKIFTLVSLLLMPPTLIASFFGMNINFGTAIGTATWMWIPITVLMILSFGIIWMVFKKKNML